MVGMAEKGQAAYGTVKREEVDYEVDFEFKATLIGANKQAVAESLQQGMAISVTPLALQAGIVGVDEIYALFRDMYKALNLDPDKYIKRPPNPMPGPKLLAEEVISIILDGKEPLVGSPLEFPQEHLMKLMEFMQSPEFGLLQNPMQAVILKIWMQKVQGMIMQQQMLAQAAGGSPPPGSEQQGKGGKPTTVSSEGTGTADNQMIQGKQNIDESVAPPGMQ
jgi:hypothetical protein